MAELRCVAAACSAGTALAAVLACCGCRTERPAAQGVAGGADHAARALRWLAGRQNADGHWGSRRHRVALTGLASLAFLAQGETPASPEFGATVEGGLCALIRDADASAAMADEDRAILVWCLSEAYGLTRVPVVRDAARTQGGAVSAQSATPWHALAAGALVTSGADADLGRRTLTNMFAHYPQATNDILNQATHLAMAASAGRWKQSGALVENVRRLSPAQWRSAGRPIQTALVLSRALFLVGGRDWLEWVRAFYPQVAAAQRVRADTGWWTPDCLGVPVTPETKGMSAEEGRIYATSIMALTFQTVHMLPSNRPRDGGVPEPARDHDEVEIKVDVPR